MRTTFDCTPVLETATARMEAVSFGGVGGGTFFGRRTGISRWTYTGTISCLGVRSKSSARFAFTSTDLQKLMLPTQLGAPLALPPKGTLISTPGRARSLSERGAS